MADPILVQFEERPLLPVIPSNTLSEITVEQVQALLTTLSTVNPPIIILPENKTFNDIKNLHIQVLPDGNGKLILTF